MSDADATPFGVPVRKFRRYLVKALRVVEVEIDAINMQQAHAIATLDAQKDKLRLLSVEEIPDVITPPAVIDPDMHQPIEIEPGYPWQ